MTAGSRDRAVPSRHTEVEIKLEADGAFQLPDLSTVPGVASATSPVEHHLDAVYYDTPELDLLAARVTLRRRSGGPDAGWHLKLPGGAGARTEVTTDLSAGGPGQVPEELTRLVRGTLRGRSPGPVARLRTARTVIRLHDAIGRPLVEVADDAVRAGRPDEHPDGPGVDELWREVEVEIVDGTAADLAGAGQALLAAGARPSGSASKLLRALTAAGRVPVEPPPVTLGRRSPAVAVVSSILHRQRRVLIAADLDLRLETPGAVLTALAAVRRLRSTLSVFGPVVGSVSGDPLRLGLQHSAKALSGVAAVEVLAERIALGLVEEPPALAAVAAAQADRVLLHRREVAKVRLANWLDSDASVQLFADLDRAIAALDRQPPDDSADAFAGKVLPPLIGAAWRRVARHAASLQARPADDAAARRVIKSSRIVRHAAELSGLALGVNPVVFAAAVEQVEETLVEHRDSARCAQLLLELGTDPQTSGTAGFVWGRLHSFEMSGAPGFVEDLADVWGRAQDAAKARWLR